MLMELFIDKVMSPARVVEAYKYGFPDDVNADWRFDRTVIPRTDRNVQQLHETLGTEQRFQMIANKVPKNGTIFALTS